MTLFLLVLACVLLFAGAGVAGHIDSRFRKHGPHALAWRWFSASGSWSGKVITNRGWVRPGSGKAFTPTGHAHRRWFLPRWQHALWRTENTIVTLLLFADLVLRPRRTAEYLGVTAAAGAVLGAYRTHLWMQDYGHRKNYVKPLHARLAADAGIPIANKPESWLRIPKDRTEAFLTWPKGAPLPKGQERDAIASAAMSTLGMSGAVVKWQFTGPQLRLHLRRPVPCPDSVTLEDVIDAIRAAGVNDLILGVGKEKKITQVSADHDSPHQALSADSGKGKSVVVRCILPQVLLRGGIGVILDNKLVSHPWARGLHNVAYCDDISKIHDFLVWLDVELNRRAQFIRGHTDLHGNLTGSPGPRMMIVLEELNLMMNRLRSYWSELLSEDKSLPREEREHLPSMSPAIRAMENASYIGRELKVHLLFVSQRLSAKATAGSGDVRMNMGTRILAGYDAATWDMLVGKQTPMPAPSRHRGRMQVYVKGGDLTETQIAFLTHAEARQLAESGKERVPAKLQHLTRFDAPDLQPVSTQARDRLHDKPVIPGVALPAAQPGPPPVENWVTIKQAAEMGWLPASWTNPGGSFRTAKSRAKKAGIPVPQVKATKGSEAHYDAVEFADFLERLTTERQAA